MICVNFATGESDGIRDVRVRAPVKKRGPLS